jgi:hypothetical protein
MTYRKIDLKDVYCEKQTGHVISMGTTLNLNVNCSGICLLYGFKRLMVNVIISVVNLF